MGEDELKRASLSLQHALEAHTLEYQTKHVSQARESYRNACRRLEAFVDAIPEHQSDAARKIAAYAAELTAQSLAAFETRLARVEDEVLREIEQAPDVSRRRRLFATE